MADDLGWSQIGCYGSDYYATPHIDRLAAEGMKFNQAYSAAAVCSPTRASIMTGKYPARLHLTDFIAGNQNEDYPLKQPDWQKFLPLDETTFAEELKKNNYTTALFGKWHLSQEKMPPESLPYNPDQQGFDESFVTYKPSGNMSQSWQDAEDDAHNVDTLTSLAVDFIQRHEQEPFFLFVSHNTIHDPLKEKEVAIRKYDTLEATEDPQNHAVIAAMIERMDNSFGQIMNQLEKSGLSERTIVIFFSDNGGKESYASQSPFRKGKGWLYEGGIRVPLIVKWPEVVKPGSESNHLVSSIDFFPSFMKMLAIDSEYSGYDGKSIVPILKNDENWIRTSLFWHYPHYHNGSGMVPAGAMRHHEYKLIEWYEPTLLEEPGQLELYNLNEDPGETTNLAEAMPALADQMRQELIEWRLNIGAQMPEVNQESEQ